MRLGADPEVFLQDATGKAISAIGLINADKWNPLQIKGMPQGFTLQEDNVALEYGIPPAANADEFVKHIQQVMEASKPWLKGLSFSKLSCTVFPKDQMQHPMAFVFGCEPDFDAWSGKENRKPKPPNEFMRSAGGHIHVETQQDPASLVKKLDLFVSVPAVFMDDGITRKQLYGKAGAHRVKPYGVEYRTPSNFWIFEEKLIRWAWRQCERAHNYEKDVSHLEDLVLEAINNNNKEVAEALVKEYELEVL